MSQLDPMSFSPDLQEDLERRGFSRRTLARAFALAAAGATLPFANEASLAQLSNIGRLPEGAVKINANEFPMSLTKAATEKLVAVAARGNRYQYEEMEELLALIGKVEGLPGSSIAAYPGSSLALQHTVLAATGPDAPLITASPGFELAARSAEFIGAPVERVPVLKDGGHDVETMVARAKKVGAGLLYVCSPNNPTGSVTPREKIDWLIANKPEDCWVLMDEAYIDFTDEPACTNHVKRGDDVVVLRTFSKIYGMAGLRAGYLMAKPDLVKKIEGFKSGAMPATAMAAAAVMLADKDVVRERKTFATAIREDLCSFFDAKGLEYAPSESFKVMVDTRKPVKQVIAGMKKHQVYVGRPWPEWPTHLRVSLGSEADMAAFKKAFLKVV